MLILYSSLKQNLLTSFLYIKKQGSNSFKKGHVQEHIASGNGNFTLLLKHKKFSKKYSQSKKT
jgi:hypothetical protein